MADLAASGAPEKLYFADGEWREVVVQHEAPVAFALDALDLLLVVRGAQRGRDERLGFAAGEDGGPMHAGQDADFGPNVSYLDEPATVETLSTLEDLVAEAVTVS